MTYTYNNSTLRGKQRVVIQETPQRGAAVLTTTAAPTDDVGENGDVSINTSNWVLHGPKTADTWDTSSSPARSISKTRIWFNDTRAPLVTEGNDGDVWIFAIGFTLNFWQKILGTWTEMLVFTVPVVSTIGNNSSSGGGDGGDGGGGE